MGLLQLCGPPGPKAKDSIKGLDTGEEEPSFASSSETEMKDAFLGRLGRGCSLLYSTRDSDKRYLSFHPSTFCIMRTQGELHMPTHPCRLCVWFG